MNKVILMGNIGRSPEYSETHSGAQKLTFSLATSKRWKNRNGEKQERTDWHNCIIWGKRAEALSRLLEKGMRVLCEGEIQYSDYEDRDGIRRFWTSIQVHSLEFAQSKGESRGGDQGARRPSEGQQDPPPEGFYDDDFPVDDDDIPF